LINISQPLPKPPQAPLDLVKAGKTAARQLRQRVETDTMGGDFERLMGRIEAGYEAALVLAASLPPPGPPSGRQPFTVHRGGRP
jgi:hypothetical protein